MLFHEFLEIFITPSNPAATVDFELQLFISGTVLYFPGQIDIHDIKQAGVNVIVKDFLTAHQFVHMTFINLINGLTVTDQPIDACKFLFAGKDPSLCFKDCLFCSDMGICRVIDHFFRVHWSSF